MYSAIQKVSGMHKSGRRLYAAQAFPFCIWLRESAVLSFWLDSLSSEMQNCQAWPAFSMA